MIRVTRLNNSEFWINPDLIQFIEETPDTVISLTTGVNVVVLEPAEEIVRAIIEFRQQASAKLPTVVERDAGEE